jgi:Dolichyl-phosphate-mannose-protein mannosyltransferase
MMTDAKALTLGSKMNKILAIILGVGFLFRLLFLGRRQLWTDEIMQGLIVRASSAREMLECLRDGMAIPAPLDYFVQKGIVSLIGESTWAMRLHAVIFGTLSLWIFFRIARHLFGDRVAIYSTVLLTFYPLHYHYSQEGRPYALLVFLSLVSYDLLFRILSRNDGRFPAWALLCCVLTLLLYASFLGILVLSSQWVALVISAARDSKNSRAVSPVSTADSAVMSIERARWWHVMAYSVVAGLACAFYLPWVYFAWAKPLVTKASEVIDPKLVLRMIKELGDGSYPMTGLLLLGAATGVRAMLRHGQHRVLVWLLTWFGISIPAVILLEIWSGYFFAIRHVLHATPPLVLLAGYGLSYVGERLTILEHLPSRISAPAIAYAVLVIVISVWIAQSHWKKETEDWLGTARFLQNNLHPGDVVTMPEVYMLLEYNAPALRNFRVGDLDPGPGSLRAGEINRRYVACFNNLKPDPCEGFRDPAVKDIAWRKQEFRGFTVFMREK